MSVVEATGLNKTFRSGRRVFGGHRRSNHVVRDVDIAADEGETVVIIGESGAGKSTTGRLITRLIEPDSGSVRILGTDITTLGYTELQEFRVNMQMIFQDPFSSLDPRMRVVDAVSEPLLVHGNHSKRELHRRSAELLERVGLGSAFLMVRPREMSGGQLQRVAIARALSVNPRLIVCDEPVSALDVSVRAQVLNLMLELQRDFDITYLFITHDLTLVPILADRVVVMCDGEVVECGTPNEIMHRPSHPYTRQLLDSIPSLVPKAHRGISAPAST